MNEELSFIEAICTNPQDDTVRLVYADWLDEHNRSGRAEFIRVQCELASLTDKNTKRVKELREREKELCYGSHLYYAQGQYLTVNLTSFTRGFASHIVCDYIEWETACRKVYWHPSFTTPCPISALPIEQVTIDFIPDRYELFPHDFYRLKKNDNWWKCDEWPTIKFKSITIGGREPPTPHLRRIMLNVEGNAYEQEMICIGDLRIGDRVSTDVQGRCIPYRTGMVEMGIVVR